MIAACWPLTLEEVPLATSLEEVEEVPLAPSPLKKFLKNGASRIPVPLPELQPPGPQFCNVHFLCNIQRGVSIKKEGIISQCDELLADESEGDYISLGRGGGKLA